MSKRNGFVLNFVLLLVSSSVFSHKSVVFGSPVSEQSFKRPDPLRHFKLYKGGYDLTNRHYWASAAFTGIHGYAIAGVWVICGLGFGTYLTLKNFIGSSSASSSLPQHSESSYIIMFLLLILFSILAIVATGLAIAANQSCLHRTKTLKETVLGAGGDARKTIRNVTDTMNNMLNLLLPYDSKTCRLLNYTSHQLARESRLIRTFVHKNDHTINRAIQLSYIANLVVVTVNLASLAAAIVLLFLHWHPGFLIIILLCWIFTTLCWVLTGFDFFFHTFADDTCSALQNFEQNPQNNSLSSILPCANSSSFDKVFKDIGYTVHTSITELNSKITQLNEFLRLDEQNDNFSEVQKICDPFPAATNYSYAPEKCPKDAIPIGDLAGVLSRFTCYPDNTGNCEHNRRFIPESTYVIARACSIALQDLINIFPDLLNLVQCSFLKDTFSNVVLHQCKPFRASTRKLWISLLSLSVVMVVLVLLWVAKAYQDRGRSFLLCSIIPNPTI
ncbi:uncharacterized protein LOC114309732 isoform X1 [Camellia sinensis]|uniref:uncharacterized protein LOC114309732 isoform X1 n=1 Tax=Camellia sinensis TaxID=4442 RepID=UPI00103652C7|nr:uncharacterized protein LOC114309732 isoform X1 [Camellia sinensis]